MQITKIMTRLKIKKSKVNSTKSQNSSAWVCAGVWNGLLVHFRGRRHTYMSPTAPILLQKLIENVTSIRVSSCPCPVEPGVALLSCVGALHCHLVFRKKKKRLAISLKGQLAGAIPDYAEEDARQASCWVCILASAIQVSWVWLCRVRHP